jgi:hypothetical protein
MEDDALLDGLDAADAGADHDAAGWDRLLKSKPECLTASSAATHAEQGAPVDALRFAVFEEVGRPAPDLAADGDGPALEIVEVGRSMAGDARPALAHGFPCDGG